MKYVPNVILSLPENETLDTGGRVDRFKEEDLTWVKQKIKKIIFRG